MPAVPSLRMNNDLEIPQLGFGVAGVPPEETKHAVAEALKAGYRLIYTAQGYRNEEGVGAAIAESDVPRDELFITTKLSEHGYDKALTAFDGSMRKLGLDVLDLFLIHWPLPMFDQYVETWRAFERLLADGRVRSIGVSNFEIPHLQRLLAETDVTPTVNQVELHPEFPQEELVTSTTSMGPSPSRGVRLVRARDCSSTPRSSRWREARAVRRRRSCCVGMCSLAVSSSRSQYSPLGSERTSTCLISNSMMPTWPRSQESGPASVSAKTRTSSRCVSRS